MIRAVLIDLSGTLHIEDHAIPGAIEALKRLQSTSLKLKFVTNTTKDSSRLLHERLTRLGFPVKIAEIHSSLNAAKNLLLERQLKPLLMVSSEALEDFEEVKCKQGEKPNSVVIGLAPEHFHYEKLTEAFRCLLEGAQLIAIHAAKYYRRSDGLALGPGCFVKGLEYSAKCKAELVGKPNENFFFSALKTLGDIKPTEAIMIGDDATDDIEGAMKAGMKGILVQTGKYRSGDEDKISPPPTFVVPSFVEAVDKIFNEISS